jgi:hypothetical protein
MGLILNVYRPADFPDCSNNGISARYDRLCVTNVSGPFDPSDDAPAVTLEKGPFNSVRLIPVEDRHCDPIMFGGNYAGTSDSRFCQAVEEMCGYRHGMIAIHDRVE